MSESGGFGCISKLLLIIVPFLLFAVGSYKLFESILTFFGILPA